MPGRQSDVQRIPQILDPLERYQEATSAAARTHRDADFLDTLRAMAVAALHATGMTYEHVAEQTGLSVARVGQLAVKGRERAWVNACGHRRDSRVERGRAEKCVLAHAHAGEHQFEFESEAPSYVVMPAIG